MENFDELELRISSDGVIIPVRVVPGSSRQRVVGVLAGRLKITTSAPAEKGKANRAVAELLAETLGVARKDVSLRSGATSSRKEFLIANLAIHQVRQRLKERVK